MFVIFDLDGTLCNIDHRLHFIKGEKKDWPSFFDACVNDEPKWPIIMAFNALSLSEYVEIWSGRSIAVKEQTEYWLMKHGIQPHHLAKMRPDGDHTPDVDLKRQWLRDARFNGSMPSLVFDDRQSVVDMWRSEGVTCCQVEAWSE